MYEEEDDDLPMQYRRLTAHLQTGSVDFNRRLSAYLTNHVAMRAALDQAVQNSYAQQFPNAPQFQRQQYMGFGSPMFNHGHNPYMMGPLMQSNEIQGHSPYNMQLPQVQQYQSYPYQQPQNQQQNQQREALNTSLHSRPASIVSPQPSNSDALNSPVPKAEDRRLSAPVEIKSESPNTKDTSNPPNKPVSMPSMTPQQCPSVPKGLAQSEIKPSEEQPALPNYSMGAFANDFPPEYPSPSYPNAHFFNPTTFQDPLLDMFLAGSEFSAPFDNNFNNSFLSAPSSKAQDQYPNFDGLNTILSNTVTPGDLNLDGTNDFEFDANLYENLKQANGHGSTTNTPGLNTDKWNEWIDTDQWDSHTATQ
jgi:hypothetical protein